MRAALLMLSLLALLPAAPALASPSGVDLHAYWDSSCKDCHGHAGDFARRTLATADGSLQGRHHRTGLSQFLKQHYLADSLVVPVTEMLIAQVSASPVFSSRCAGCHGTAAEFARRSLVVKEGVLTGRRSDRPVVGYLESHGGLAPAERPVMIDTLERVLREVGGS